MLKYRARCWHNDRLSVFTLPSSVFYLDRPNKKGKDGLIVLDRGLIIFLVFFPLNVSVLSSVQLCSPTLVVLCCIHTVNSYQNWKNCKTSHYSNLGAFKSYSKMVTPIIKLVVRPDK